MSEDVIARAAELAAIEGFLSEVNDGPSAFLLDGPAGIGKTILWAAGRASAADQLEPSATSSGTTPRTDRGDPP